MNKEDIITRIPVKCTVNGESRTLDAYPMERLLDAGYACAWGRYRTEVELGFHNGGRLVVDQRQGMDLMNRSPLEFEDEIAILDHVAKHPQIDPERLGHVGVSHAGEMLFKIASQYDSRLKAGVACEPANHEFLDLTPDDSAFTNPEHTSTGLSGFASKKRSIIAAVSRCISNLSGASCCSCRPHPAASDAATMSPMRIVARAMRTTTYRTRPPWGSAKARPWRRNGRGVAGPRRACRRR